MRVQAIVAVSAVAQIALAGWLDTAVRDDANVPMLLASHPRAAQSPQLRLELQCVDAGRLLATIHNDGTADTAVIFGAVLNGAKHGR